MSPSPLRLVSSAVLLVALTTGIACEARKPPPAGHKKEPKSYPVVGELRSLSDGGKKALIKHEAIPGYMMAMTMEFNVKNPDEVKGLQPGDKIQFRLTPTDDSHWIDQIVKVGSAAPGTATPPPPASPGPPHGELKKGDAMPDVELIGEDGKVVRLSTFRGKALAFTFIFTRCPLPDYCPRMGNFFGSARQLLLGDKAAPANWQLLSISFDPEHDSPEVLRTYAAPLRASNADRWLFATAPQDQLKAIAPRLDLMIKKDGESFQHNLRTVVLDTKGRIHKQLDGNEWTPRELASAIGEAARIK